MSEQRKNWEDVLNPEIMRERLISVSIFIIAFELLRETIVDNLRAFYADGYDSNGTIVGNAYETEVLSRNRSVVYASLDWLLSHDAINAEDIESYERIKRVRNRVAHELLHVFTKGEKFNLVEEFDPLIALMRKIGTWWIVNVEVPTNPDYDGEEIDEDGIVPGAILSLQIMLEVVSGNSELLDHYRKAIAAKNEKH